MESSAFHERVKRLKEVNEVIGTLDPAIREGAFSLLVEYVTGHPHKSKGGGGQETGDSEPHDQPDTAIAELFAKHPDGKPSDYAVAIAAHLYSQYGAQPFKLEEIRTLADSFGVTIPTSLNMTMKQAQRDGKSLFQHTGRSEYKPTVHGELYFKKTYEVSKGTKQRLASRNVS
jgi:hypothetical protein